MKYFSALACALLLMSCTDEQPAAEVNSQNAAETPAAAPPLPTKSEPQALAPLTAEGWGPLRIGMSLDEVTKALGPDSDPEAVGGPEPESCDEFRPERAPPGMLVMIEDGRLTSISLIDNSPVATDRGLRLGDPAAAVTKAYGSSLATSPHKYQDAPAAYLTWWTKGGAASDWIEDPAARGIRYELDESGKVGTIHAGGPSIQYVEGCA